MSNKWWDSNIDKDISDIVVKLNATISGKSINKNWTEDLSLNYEDIDTDMENVPSILAFWSAVLAEARREKGLIQIKLDIRRSKVLEGIKSAIQDGIKLTVSDKDNLVNVDPEFIKLQKRFIDLDSTISKLFGIVDAIKIKADNLRSFAAMKRAELNNS